MLGHSNSQLRGLDHAAGPEKGPLRDGKSADGSDRPSPL